MEGTVENPLPLRGPSLPGSLEVRGINPRENMEGTGGDLLPFQGPSLPGSLGVKGVNDPQENMEGTNEDPLSLRGPSLPGSLGVRVRGDWETFEEENTGIDMRSGDCEDINVQLDFMKETGRDQLNGIDCGAVVLDKHMEGSACSQSDSVQGQGTSGICEGIDKRSIEMRRVSETNIELSHMNRENADLKELDMDETGRKCPIPSSIQIINSRGDQDPLEPQEAQHMSSGECEAFSSNSLFLRPQSGSQDQTLPLPPGKKYHVFFSYDMADRDWVHSVVEKMESEHGYRCSFHERDFHGGKGVIENIMEHILWSVKTVLVLSPDFLKSSWCDFEMKQGLHASIEEARMLIVMVRECEVPDTLRSLTYIDATPGADWWGRFMEAISAQDTLQVCNDAGNQIAIQPRYENLNDLYEISSKFGCCVGESLEMPYMPEALNRPEIQISPEEFDEVISKLRKVLNRTCSMLYCCDFTPVCLCLMALSCCLTLSLFPFGLLLLVYNRQPSTRDQGAVYVAVPVLITLIYMFLFFTRIRWRKRIRRTVRDLNQQLYRSKIIMDIKLSSICKCSSIRAKISFRYYDFNPCMKHVKDFMSAADEASIGNNLSRYSDQLAIEMLEEYLQKYQDGNLKFQRGSSPRHVRHAKCLCQYVEHELENQDQWLPFCQRKLEFTAQAVP